jgi:hypothetical protein
MGSSIDPLARRAEPSYLLYSHFKTFRAPCQTKGDQVPPNRRYERIPVDIPAQVGKEKVRVRNLSRGGAFIHGLAAGELFEKVTVNVKGTVLEGHVRWVRGSEEYGFGIEFAAELPEDKFQELVS